MIEVYKILHKKYDRDVATFLKLKKDESSRTGLRGHSMQLFPQRANRTLRHNSFTMRVIPVWNKLPQEVIEAPSTNSFKNRLDKYWSKQEMLYDYRAPYTGRDMKLTYEDLEGELTIEASN